MNWSLGSKDASRGMKANKPSLSHEEQACRREKASGHQAKLGLSGALSRESLLEAAGRGGVSGKASRTETI